MTSITTWVRLEPQARDADMTPGVEARLHDPLWLLARQWQLGELDGEDGGSAVIARARYDVGRVHALAAAGGAPAPYDPAALPLAAAIEAAGRAGAAPVADVRAQADAGRHLARRLGRARLDAHVPAFVRAFPIAAPDDALDETDRRFVAAVRGRAPDGDAAAAALRPHLPGLPPELDVGADTAAVAAVCAQWLAWYDAREVQPPAGATWKRDRLEYAATLHASLAGREVALDVREHHGRPLDWARFELRDVDASSSPPVRGVAAAVPSTVAYRGMPARRYWELEDGAVDWNAVDAGPGDAARMLLVDFAIVFSDDWSIIPIDVDADTLVRVTSLVVTDTFGVRTRVDAAAGGRWRMFTCDAEGAPVLFAAAPPPPLAGPTLDEVIVVADEQANVAWAIERASARADGDGRTVPADAVPPAPDGETPRYRLGTHVPAGWHPLVPRADRRLGRARVPGLDRAPRTALVAGLRELAADELATGVARLSSRYRLARRADGRVFVWRAYDRETAPRVSMPPSGLVFDTVER